MDFQGVVTEILRETSYRLDDFYRKTYLDGGITMEQANGLYEEIQKVKENEYKLQASMHGIEMKDGPVTQSDVDSQKVPLFGDPEAYKDMSEQEKENLTQKMLGKHKTWSGDKLKGK